MKKQFRLYDIYRTAVTEEISDIFGIKAYSVDDEARLIIVVFTNGDTIRRFCRIEDERKAVVKEVNKILRNCRKPGRKVNAKEKY